MRMLSHSLALLLQLLLLHATVLGGGVACAARAGGAPHAPQGAQPVAHQNAHHDAAPADADAHHGGDREPGRDGRDGRSDAPLHCGIAAACLAPALASRAEPLSLPGGAAERVRAVQDAAPRSASLAPEPPPPRR